MRHLPTLIKVLASCLLLLVSAGCGSSTRVPAGEPLQPLSEPAVSLTRPGPVAFQIESGSHNSPTGCTLPYNIYRPQQVNSEAMVILAHGFKRNMSTMRGWARHWASFGVPVTVLSLCNSSWFNPLIERNAADLVSLASVIHQGPVVYAGFSAGGLAALLAADADARTLAYLGLDSVDSDNLATSNVSQLDFPALQLVAEPAFCNANNNIVQDFRNGSPATVRPTVFRIRYATHCYFASPYSRGCTTICGSIKPASAEPMILDTIRSLATAWVLKQTTADPRATDILMGARQGKEPWGQRVELLN